jgi:hypothetical protein
MEDLNLYQNLYNENYTDVRKNELIQKVFENKTKALLSEKSEVIKMADGGEVEDRIYTPYEFLHELLPQVYGRPYVVSDLVGKEYTQKIEQEQKELDEYVDSRLAEYGVNSLYKIDNKKLIEEIEIRRRKLISDKSFITESELNAYLFCHPELHSEHYVKELPIYDVDSMVSSGHIMIDYDKSNDSYSYVYRYEYLSGNLYKKLTRLRYYKDRLQELKVLTNEQFELQVNELKNNMPIKGKITTDLDTCVFILPKSKFAQNFMIHQEDVNDYKMYESMNFYKVFKGWTSSELDKALITKSDSIDQIHEYFTDFKKLESKPTKDQKAVYSKLRKNTYFDGRIILKEFLNKALTTECQLRLEYEWNETYNFYTEPKFYKFPVACRLSNKFKNGRKFTPNETQIQSIQFMRNVGSGLLAYGVGVGKTASAILNISYALDNNLCKKPIFIVPNATYEKWKMEMFGGVRTIYEVNYTENETNLVLSFEEKSKAEKFKQAVNGTLKVKSENIYGHISHLTKVVDLYNLNEQVLSKIKTYTDIEELQIKTISELLAYLKKVPKNYKFDNPKINNEIKSKYDDFEVENLQRDYNDFIEAPFQNWWLSRANREQVGFDIDRGREYFGENEAKKTIKEFFEKGIATYREELPYILGTLNTFEDGTIFLATYQALKHLGFVMQDNYELRDNRSFYGKMFNEISQGENVSNISYDADKNIAVLWRDSIYGKIKTKVDIRELGLDYVVFDESHYLKKSIVDCKGIPSGRISKDGYDIRNDRRYTFGAGTLPSPLSLTGYFLTRYVQENNNSNNVIHLTATPFTNKPAEIYSMLSITNRKMLLDSDLKYMQEFFDVFMDISFDLVFGNTGVERRETLLGYKNLPQLRNLIYSMMDYKSGEDANIKRPEKILFPSAENNRETTIPETPQQDILFKQIKNYQRGKIDWEELCADAVQKIDVDELTEDELIQYINDNGTEAQIDKYEKLEKPLSEEEFEILKNAVTKLVDKSAGFDEEQLLSKEGEKKEIDSFRVVKGLTMLKSVTLSPYLSVCQKEAQIEPTYLEYIDSSPKLKYTIECIKTIHEYELENNLVKSGIVIYMNLGVNVSFKFKDGSTFKWKDSGLDKIKKYLINRMGYSAEEVSIVSGGMSNIDKEREKNKFLSGKSSVLIGSSSISTGVDLQDNASALFLCSFDWNPTDNEQIAGRIHRQGNRFEKIRIVYPMVRNSADPSIFQQLYEKTLRIKNIWDKNDKGNTLDLKDFDLNTLRKGIMDEPEDLAKYWEEEQIDEIETMEKLYNARLTNLDDAVVYKNILDRTTNLMKGMIVVLDAFKKYKDKKQAFEKYNEKIGGAEQEFKEKESELLGKLKAKEIKADEFQKEFDKAEEKLNKVLEKFKEDVYDFENDPEGKYRFLTYDELGEGDELSKNISTYITNSNSNFRDKSKIDDADKKYIYYNWLRDNFPRFQEGKYNLSVPEEEDVKLYVDYDSNDPLNYANNWKNAYKIFNKVKESLRVINITLEEIPQTIQFIKEEQERLEQEKTNIKQQIPQKMQEYIIAKEERMITQTSLQERVDEFASMNNILHEVVPVLPMDKAKFVKVPTEKLPIKPSKKDIEKEIEEAVIIEEVEKEEAVEEIEEVENLIDTSNLIENLKSGMVVRFSLEVKKNKNTKEVDIFYEDGEFISYVAFVNSKGDILTDEEDTLTEQEVIDFYIKNNKNITDEFFEDSTNEKEIITSEIEKEEEVENLIDTSNLIENLKSGMVVRFDLGKKINVVIDLFYENNEYIKYSSILNKKGEFKEDIEDKISEEQVIDFYISNYDNITDEFFDTGEEDEEEIITSKTQTKTQTKTKLSKTEVYNQLIEGYELSLELETDEEKIKMFNDLIEGYQLALELEN